MYLFFDCLTIFVVCSNSFALVLLQPSQKSFRTKRTLAVAQKHNKPIPHWIRLRTDNTIKLVDVLFSPFCLFFFLFGEEQEI
jgi:large subunit ribosomal protein L39e